MSGVFKGRRAKIVVEGMTVTGRIDSIEFKDEVKPLTEKELAFVEAGRQINEYREGDIIKIDYSGSFAEVVEKVGETRVRVSTHHSLYRTENVDKVTPIAFVENRVDTKQ